MAKPATVTKRIDQLEIGDVLTEHDGLVITDIYPPGIYGGDVFDYWCIDVEHPTDWRKSGSWPSALHDDAIFEVQDD